MEKKTRPESRDELGRDYGRIHRFGGNCTRKELSNLKTCILVLLKIVKKELKMTNITKNRHLLLVQNLL